MSRSGTWEPTTKAERDRQPDELALRERLLRSAQELIEEGGYAAAPVAAIAERAGVAAGTLYRHFDSKQELFVEVFRSVCAREERAMRAAAERLAAANAVERLEVVLATFAERALRNPRLAWALLAEPVDPRSMPSAWRIASATRRCRETLRAAIAADEVPAQNIELTAAALVGGCGEVLVGPLSPLAGARPTRGS